MRLHIVVVISLVLSIQNANGIRLAEKMYKNIVGSSCFRRFNATHTTGCSSKFQGSVGVLHFVKTQSEMAEFLASSWPSAPYAPILAPHLFTRENMMKLKELGEANLISVVVLLNDFSQVQTFSHESQCPNQYSRYDRSGSCDYQWNPVGTNLLFENFPFPIYFVSDQAEVEKIVDCFERFNSGHLDADAQDGRSLCSIQVNSVMSGAVNSEVCMRRSIVGNFLKPVIYCDPLQGRNVYATLFPREIIDANAHGASSNHDDYDGSGGAAADPNERFILVTARMDTTSMFDGIGVGAMGSLVSFATLLSTAHVLSKLLPPSKRAEGMPNVLFVLLNGESYDYVGSQRLIYDMNRNEFPFHKQQTRPIRLSNIDLLLDIGTLDDINNPVLYNLHGTSTNELKLFNEMMRKYNGYHQFNITTTYNSTVDIPPTSAHTFLHENRSLPIIIVNAAPKNKFYHSIYDTDLNIAFEYKNKSAGKDFLSVQPLDHWQSDFNATDIQMGIRNLSTVLAYSLYEMVTKKSDNVMEMGANAYLIDEFLYCWLFSARCRLLMTAVNDNATLFPHYPPRYISIDRSYSIRSTVWTYDLMGLLIGEQRNNSKESCQYLPLRWYPGLDGHGVCMYTTQNYSAALSPAFRIPNYNWTSGEYSTWTESTWSSMSARIFLQPSHVHNAFTLSVGVIVLVLSFIVVYMVNAKTDVLFENGPTSTEAITPALC